MKSADTLKLSCRELHMIPDVYERFDEPDHRGHQNVPMITFEK